MQRRHHGHHGSESGAALTEFAILLPVLVAIIYGSMYLTDLGTLKLKAMEIARYGAWGLASRPLSNYESFRHRDRFTEARDEVSLELFDLYADLDGARTRMPEMKLTLAGVYDPPGPSDFRNETVQILPAWAQVQWTNPLSLLGVLLAALNVGSGSNSLFGGGVSTLRMNAQGQVHARSTLRIQPPIRSGDAERARQMARAGRVRGADLSRWDPAGRPLRDPDGRDIHVTLIADSWRVTQGHSARPGISNTAERHYANVVTEVSKHGIEALPGGPLLSWVLGAMRIVDNLPGGLSTLLGIPANQPAAHLISRPYYERRSLVPNYRGTPLPGQVDIFAATASSPQEDGAVRNFETGALFVDPNAPRDSEYFKALQCRGPGFLGCPDPQTRGCWETRRCSQ